MENVLNHQSFLLEMPAAKHGTQLKIPVSSVLSDSTLMERYASLSQTTAVSGMFQVFALPVMEDMTSAMELALFQRKT